MSKETSKQIFFYSTSKWWLLEWLAKVWKGEEGKWKVVFQIYLIYFWFYQMQRWAKTNMQCKRRKENGGFGGERQNSNANGGRENGITTSLPPGESFMFIIREQDCLHTFED
jgi:hypothetical protein